MFLPIYLATTAQEFTQYKDFPSTLCYLACHFSSSGTGLSNLPCTLPLGSIISIDDSTPIASHQTDVVIRQIATLVEKFHPCGILLDFQRPDNPYAADMIEAIIKHTSCTVAVSHIYAKDHNCPVFLPPLPFRLSVTEYLQPWKGRELWLEIGNDKEMAIITANSFGTERIHSIPTSSCNFREPSLLCHYSIHIKPDHIALYFHRTANDLEELQAQAKELGVTKFLGLWQQLQQFYS